MSYKRRQNRRRQPIRPSEMKVAAEVVRKGVKVTVLLPEDQIVRKDERS